jgi:dTDP-4-dehydrorhamnose reductase
VTPIATADYPTPARRPTNSILDCTRFERTFALPRRPWTERLDAVVGSLLGARDP